MSEFDPPEEPGEPTKDQQPELNPFERALPPYRMAKLFGSVAIGANLLAEVERIASLSQTTLDKTHGMATFFAGACAFAALLDFGRTHLKQHSEQTPDNK